ncbi:lycopene cyclase family protein [Wenjunlia vitaminophila]|uniref:lycopene cyclase family protein n=1 Tax=Wenjunlia vitaminophila TaxID=76728 RepID=UPI000594E7E4|nr:lycopene cyclase family protein [Wenjunlia vitaminophila]
MSVPEVDVAIVGAGAAGLSLARLLADPVTGGWAGDRAPPVVVLLQTPEARLRPADRTWCWWEEPPGDLDGLTFASWPRVRVYDPGGGAVESDIAPYRYHMIRSADYERAVGRCLDRGGVVRRVSATVTGISDHRDDAAEVRCVLPGGARWQVRARWVFDSRPPSPLPAARTVLLQHFRGWFVRTREPRFDPDVVVLMDLRVPQPECGLAFGYVVPFDRCAALVEYTGFSRAVLGVAAYETALRRYAGDVLGLGRYRVEAAEQGVIVMTDAVFPRRVGRRVFRIGAAGGATRPSTGYTFAATQRQVRAVAAAYAAGRTPVPPPAYSARARALDAVLLRALDTGRVEGADFFARLFRRNRAGTLLRFLDGSTRWHQDARIGLTTPVGPMLRTAVELPWVRRGAAGGG